MHCIFPQIFIIGMTGAGLCSHYSQIQHGMPWICLRNLLAIYCLILVFRSDSAFFADFQSDENLKTGFWGEILTVLNCICSWSALCGSFAHFRTISFCNELIIKICWTNNLQAECSHALTLMISSRRMKIIVSFDGDFLFTWLQVKFFLCFSFQPFHRLSASMYQKYSQVKWLLGYVFSGLTLVDDQGSICWSDLGSSD